MNQVPLLHQAEAESLARNKGNGVRRKERRKAKGAEMGAEMGKIQDELKYDTLLRYLSHLLAMGAGAAIVQYQSKFSLIGTVLIIFVIDHLYLGARRVIWAKMTEDEAKRKRVAQQQSKKNTIGKENRLQLRRDCLLSQSRVELLDDRVVDGNVAYRILVAHQQDKWSIWHVFSEFEALRETISHLKKTKEASWHVPSLRGGHHIVTMTLPSDALMKRKDRLRAFVAAIILNIEIAELDEVRHFFQLPPLSEKGAEEARILALRDDAINAASKKEKSMLSDIPILGSGYAYISSMLRSAAGKEEGGEDKSSHVNDNSCEVTMAGNERSSAESDPFRDQPAYLRSYFEDSGSGNQFKVRGSNYLNDKLKVSAGPSVLRLVHASMYKSDEFVYHISSIGLCKRRLDEYIASTPEGKKAPFLFIVNVMVPGDPIVNIVLWWAFDQEMAEKMFMSDATKQMLEQYAAISSSGYERLDDKDKSVNSDSCSEADDSRVSKGLFPSRDFRNERFKLIPNIVEGPFIVKKAVGNTPALLGKKLTQRYFRGPYYVETDVDVSSSVVALNIVGLCRGYARQIVVDIGICLEGRAESELPEQMIGVVRMLNPDVDRAEPLED